MNNPFQIKATIQNNQIPISNSFHVKFYIGQEILKDTVLITMGGHESREMSAQAQLPEGRYQVKVWVDREDDVMETSETNNDKEIFVDIIEGTLIVRPNPFTPNNDGFNDEAIFNFSELNLKQPELRLFNFQGQEIIKLNEISGHLFKWDGKDRNGTEMLPGIYLYLLKEGKKLIAKGSIVLAR